MATVKIVVDSKQAEKDLKSLEKQTNENDEAFEDLDKETKKTFTLDPISFLIWVQCDGNSTVDEIVDLFSVNGNRDIVKSAIESVLEKLENNGLIKWVEG